jgi:hypothetical protein
MHIRSRKEADQQQRERQIRETNLFSNMSSHPLSTTNVANVERLAITRDLVRLDGVSGMCRFAIALVINNGCVASFRRSIDNIIFPLIETPNEPKPPARAD